MKAKQGISNYHLISSIKPTTSIHHTSMYIEFKLFKCKQAYLNAHSNATYKFMSLLSLLVCSNFNRSLSFIISLPYVKALPLCHLTLSLCNFSPFVINDHKGLRLRLSMSINGVRIIFPNLVQSRTLAKDI